MSIATDLRGRLTGRVLDPADEGFAGAARPWSLAHQPTVRAVVEAATAADVAATVRYAAGAGLAVAPQAVGHGANAALDDTILLRTGALRDVVVAEDLSGVLAGAGTPWSAVLPRLSGRGVVPLAGSSPSPSVVGYTLGGGISWFGRRYGQAAASVTAFDVVTADGEPARVTAEENADLFWALRGGGGDFAVVTAIEFRLHPAPALAGGRLYWPASRAPEVLDAYLACTAEAPDELSLWSNLLALPDLPQLPPFLRGKRLVTVDVTYLGDAADGRKLLRHLEAVGEPMGDSFGPLDVADLGGVSDEPSEPSSGLAYGWLLDRVDVGPLLDGVRPDFGDGPGTPLVDVQLRHLGGALAQPVPDCAAPALDEPYSCAAIAIAPTAEARPAAEERFAALASALGTTVAPRVPFNMLTGDRTVEDGFPPAALARLREIKRDRDPNGVLRSNWPV